MLKKIVISAILSFLIGMAGCDKDGEPKKISLEGRRAIPAARSENNVRHLRAAAGGMITPKEGLIYYREFLDYLGRGARASNERGRISI